MDAKPLFDQRPGEIIAVDRWQPDEDFPIFPTGQKPKRALMCPSPAPHRFLLAGHRYLFKEPDGYTAQQIWSEVIAYKLSRHLPVEVPPAFLGFDARAGSAGVLVEFFLGHGSRRDLDFVPASDRFQARHMTFSTRQGSLKDNISLSRQHNVPNPWEWWARTVAFDALIGNTDRHSQNWGFLVRRPYGAPAAYELAPVFDNGSSMNFVVRDQEIVGKMRPADFDRLITRGMHHYAWTAADPNSARGHATLAGSFAKRGHGVTAAMSEIASLSDAALESILSDCVESSSFPVAFTEERAGFVRAQVRARRAALQQGLGG